MKIEKIEKIENNSDRYDIEVADNHNYFANNFLVHNTKLTLLRNSKPFDKKDFTKNWIVSYKGSVMYNKEFTPVNREIIKRDSIGISQYALIFDHLKRIHPYTQLIPKNTEFFLEFIMNKPTLTRKYESYHDLILLDRRSVNYNINFNNILSTEEKEGNLHNLHVYSKYLGIRTPRKLIKGKLFPFNKLLENTIDIELRNHFLSHKDSFEKCQRHIFKFNYLDVLKEALLSFESEFGNKMEGVVFTDKDNNRYKILQEDQHDSVTRKAIKQKYKGSKEEETEYYRKLYNVAEDLINIANDDTIRSFEENLNLISRYVYNVHYAGAINHPKKNDHQVRDDLYLTTKILLIKNRKGNNGALFLGRFDPPTKMHINIVENAYRKYDYVIIGIVNKNRVIDIELTKKMWRDIFPSIEIVEARTGNLVRFIQKTDSNINAILAGTDREETYKIQLQNNPMIKVDHIPRVKDISATQLRAGLKYNDSEQVKRNLDSRHYKYIEQLKNFLS